MLEYLLTLLQMRLGNEEGQSMIEYVLLIALIAIVVIAVLVNVAPQINNTLNTIINNL